MPDSGYQQIAATEWLLCDPEADVRALDHEWPIWVGIGHSAATAGTGSRFEPFAMVCFRP